MIPDKRKPAAGQSRYILDFPDFGRMDSLRAAGSLTGKDAPFIVNFSCKKRVLSDGFGTSVYAALPAGVTADGVFIYRRYGEAGRDDRLLVRSVSGNFYERKLEGQANFYPVTGLNFSQPPDAVNYRLAGLDVLVLASEADGMKIYDGTEVRAVPDAPRITSMCLHYERLFVTVGGRRDAVWFSDDLDVSNWNVSLEGAGFIEFADDGGDALKVLTFIDKVYVFRRYSIHRLTAYADQSEFSVSPLYVSSGRIFEKTVCVCGDRILFSSQNGLFVFDGVSASKILDRYDGFVEFSEQNFAVYAGGVYYLGFERNGGNYLFCYDLNTGEECVFGGGVQSICAADTELFSKAFVTLYEDGKNVYEMIPGGGRSGLRLYVSRTVKLAEDDSRRLVRKVILQKGSAITLKVVTDEGYMYFDAMGGKTEIFSCGLKGRTLRFEITGSGSKTVIYPPSFEIRTLE